MSTAHWANYIQMKVSGAGLTEYLIAPEGQTTRLLSINPSGQIDACWHSTSTHLFIWWSHLPVKEDFKCLAACPVYLYGPSLVFISLSLFHFPSVWFSIVKPHALFILETTWKKKINSMCKEKIRRLKTEWQTCWWEETMMTDRMMLRINPN